MNELDITINGVKLTPGQAMTVHVALQSYAHRLSEEKYPLGNDEHGKFMTKSYLANIASINEIYVK